MKYLARMGLKKVLALMILAQLPGTTGCGIGWLYMRFADSQRIKGLKVLTEDNAKTRFKKAQTLYAKALNNYEESILYDEVGNPEVYYKYGYTYLLSDPPAVEGAKGKFKDALKKLKSDWHRYVSTTNTKRVKDAEGRSISREALKDAALADELEFLENLKNIPDPEPNEDFALALSGMGICYFLDAVQKRIPVKDSDDKTYVLAVKYFETAERYSKHPKMEVKKGFFQNLMDQLDLLEVVQPTPHAVNLARVYLYQASRLVEDGHGELALNKLTNAADALERVRIFYENEPRFLTEMANYHHIKYQIEKSDADLEKAMQYVTKINVKPGYWDTRSQDMLKVRLLLSQKKADDAKVLLEELVDLDATDPKAQLLLARYHALKGDLGKIKDVFDNVFILPAHENSVNLLVEAGHVYRDIQQYESAKKYYLKATYVEKNSVVANYYLGMAYRGLEDHKNAAICFGRVVRIDASSTYAKEVSPYLNSP